MKSRYVTELVRGFYVDEYSVEVDINFIGYQ